MFESRVAGAGASKNALLPSNSNRVKRDSPVISATNNDLEQIDFVNCQSVSVDIKRVELFQLFQQLGIQRPKINNYRTSHTQSPSRTPAARTICK